MVEGETSVKEGVDIEMANVASTHPDIKNNGAKGQQALKCLEEVIYAYLVYASKKDDNDKGMTKAQVKKRAIRKPRGKKILPTPSSPGAS